MAVGCDAVSCGLWFWHKLWGWCVPLGFVLFFWSYGKDYFRMFLKCWMV